MLSSTATNPQIETMTKSAMTPQVISAAPSPRVFSLPAE
jgi:hypothetical protein